MRRLLDLVSPSPRLVSAAPARFGLLGLASLVAACGASPSPVAPAPCPTTPAVASVPAPATAGTSAPEAALPDSDEGMWLLNAFPNERFQKRYGFAPTQAFLDHVRMSSVKLALGCSGSIVSSRGLVMTNHHCAERCLTQVSSKQKDYQKDGFYAKADENELRCPGMEVDQLVGIDDVTDQMNAATKGLDDAAYNEAQRTAQAKIEKACATSDAVRCDVVSLYRGGKYHLYKYKRFQDVRLVFAPEQAIAFFGGDPDNFNFPRYDLDVTYLRLYDGDKPAATPEHFAWSKSGAKEGDLTFVAGHPGSTSRLLTVAQLGYLRDVRLPELLMWISEVRGQLTAFQRKGAEQKRTSAAMLDRTENALKALRGRYEALLDPAFFASKVAAEKALRESVAKDAQLASIAGAWDAIERATARMRTMHARYELIEHGAFTDPELLDFARTLVRAADELPKPNEQRLREYADAKLPRLKQELFSPAPVHAELEQLLFEMTFTRLRAELGPDDPFVKKVLGQQSPAELAASLVKGTKLADPKVRKQLFEGGKAAIEASKDPLVVLARAMEPDARALRKQYEDEVDSVQKKNGELVAKARFAAYGTSVYPDATFSLRLSYGKVQGWDENGKHVAPITTIGGAFDRATGRDPFALPKSWLDAKAKLDLNTPFDFATTNDIIGGNSGSPVIDKDGAIVGLIFDGNIHSLGGDYGYDPTNNRAVAVHSQALVEALDKVYGAKRVLGELGK